MAVERIVPRTNAWRESYADHAQRYQTFLHLVPGKKVLDAACGVGYGSHLIATAGAAEVTGVDISAEALDYATAHFSHPVLRFLSGDCTALPFADASFDVIFSFETLEHIQDADKAVAEFTRCLRPGGRLLASTPNRLTHSMNPAKKAGSLYHVNEMTFAEFSALMGKYLTVEQCFHQSPTLAHSLAKHVSALDLSIQRSLLLKVENLFRRALGKAQLSTGQSTPSLADVLNITPEPVLPLPPESVLSPEELNLFLIQALKPL